MTDFPTELERRRLRLEAALHALTPPPETRPKPLHAAMAHSLQAGGKRLRPILVEAFAELFGSELDATPAAVAVELLHTYTLIHDDLPAMDDSPLRRGKPSVHVAFDEATAILAGDALLTETFSLLARSYRSAPTVGIALVAELAEAAGSKRLIGGQAEDTAAENQVISAEELDYIHLNKTAALLEACGRMGAILGAATDAQIATVTRALRALGLAFQIQDDILDATSTAEAMGKTVGADAANAKNTYVAFHGLEKSQAKAAALTEEALSTLAELPGDRTFLEALFRALLDRQN
jgi:geranylgeranyl pyrophosphate synthase